MPVGAPDNPQPLTLSFRVGPIPIRVEPWFWLITLMMGPRSAPWMSAAWLGIVFVSILVHELGHAVMCLAFGSPTHIRLYSFGGLTYHKPLPRLPSILVSLAGPFAGFALGGVLYVVWLYGDVSHHQLRWTLYQSMWVNFGWGLLNLLPIVPLDGGHVLQGILGESRQRLAHSVSILTAVAAVAWSLTREDRYLIVFFAFLAFGSVRALFETPEPVQPVYRERRQRLKPGEEEGLLERGWAQLFAGKDAEAEQIGRQVLTESVEAKYANRALDLLAWVMLARADSVGALRQIERIQPKEQVRALTQAMALELAGHLDAALAPALQAHAQEPSEATARLALRLLSPAGRFDEALRIAESAPWKRPGVKESALSGLYAVKGDHQQATLFAQQAFELRRHAADAVEAARHLSRNGDPSGALGWIERALDAGYDDVSSLKEDPDFDAVRALPGFAALINRTPPGAAA